MPKMLYGDELADFIKARQLRQARNLRQSHGVQPALAIVVASDNPVIESYVRLKQRYGQDIEVKTEVFRENSQTITGRIEALSRGDEYQGIIVQLPLEADVDTDDILRRVAPEKDVDGLGPEVTAFDPATPQAIHWLLAGYNIELKNKSIALVGRGRLVGAPLEKMWIASGLEVTVLEQGDDLTQLVEADVIVSATGAPGIISDELVKPGAVVVDAGTASESGKIVGDSDPALQLRSDITITPPKGGVGPLTVASLFENVLIAARRTTENS